MAPRLLPNWIGKVTPIVMLLLVALMSLITFLVFFIIPWSETTYAAAGSVSGTASGNTVHAIISGDKFSGRMSINVSGSSHTINIVQLDPKSGSYRQAASVALHR